MEKEKNRIQEADIPVRRLYVDDEKLFNLKKIYFSQVDEVCTPSLEKLGFSVENLGLKGVNVLGSCPIVSELRFYDSVHGVWEMFTFRLRRDEEIFLALYAPYSSTVYILKEVEEAIVCGGVGVGASVRLNCEYFFKEGMSKACKYVYLYARVGKVEKTFFRRRKFLRLTGELSVQKTVNYSYKNEVEAFADPFLFSEVCKTGKLFEFTGLKK